MVTRAERLGSPVLPESGPEERVLTRETWQRIGVLARRRWGRRRIAEETGVDVKTVRRYLAQRGWQPRRSREVESLLDHFVEFLRRRAPEVGWRARILVREIREQGYEGSYRTVARFVHPLREAGRRREEATGRFETPPGLQAQVDWGVSRLWFGEDFVPVHLFVMTLGFSRRMYLRGNTSERLASLIDGHERAFGHFGGRTEEILYDIPRTIVLDRDLEGHFIRWNPVFLDFADYYSFEPRLRRVRRARTKGKVERGVGYFKGNGLPGKRWHGMEHFNEWALEWTTREAYVREHGTTRERPIDRFEREGLLPVEGRGPNRVERTMQKNVSSEGLVRLWRSYYSVPPRFIGQEVTVIQAPREVENYRAGERIATRLLSTARHRVVRERGHEVGLLRAVGERRRPEPPRFDPPSALRRPSSTAARRASMLSSDWATFWRVRLSWVSRSCSVSSRFPVWNSGEVSRQPLAGRASRGGRIRRREFLLRASAILPTERSRRIESERLASLPRSTMALPLDENRPLGQSCSMRTALVAVLLGEDCHVAVSLHRDCPRGSRPCAGSHIAVESAAGPERGPATAKAMCIIRRRCGGGTGPSAPPAPSP